MTVFRLPGVLCVATNALPIDAGTLVRASTLPPVPAGTNVKGAGLSDYDYDLIEQVAGRNIDGTPFSLAVLMSSHAEHVRRYEEAVSHLGVQSWAALFERATVGRLAELIEEAQLPHGAASEELRELLTHTQDDTGQVSDKQLSVAVGKVLVGEKERQSRGFPDSTGQYAMSLVAEAIQVFSKRKRAELENLIEAAKRPDSRVTEGQLESALIAALVSERQRQLLGVSDEGPDGLGTMSLVVEVIEIVHDRRTKALTHLIENAKQPGSQVTRKQLSDAVAEVLGTERQKQLLGGVDDATSDTGMELMRQALAIVHNRDKAEVKNLIENAKRPGSTVTRKQLSDALARLLGDERQLQLLGATDDDLGDQEVWEVMEEVSKVAAKLKNTSANGVVRFKHTMFMAPVHVIGRVTVPGEK